METPCPSCGAKNVARKGRIQDIRTFAGNQIDTVLPRSSLYQCRVCNLYFRWPRLRPEELDGLYKGGNPEAWQYEVENRRDWQIARDWIRRTPDAGSILDIGCWDGKFLEILAGAGSRSGIEINPAAKKRALAKGIEIIADNISEMASSARRFDVTTAFDVIEHVEYPLDFVRSMTALTRTNGHLMISSGNTEAMPWKITGSRYWYCSLPEHLSFINEAWCRFAAEKLGLEIEYREKFSHAGKKSIPQRVFGLSKNIAYVIVPAFYRYLRNVRYRALSRSALRESDDRAPSWAARDHLVVILRKKQ